MTNIEVEKLRDECKNNVRDSAIIDFLLATGVRVSELCALNIDNVDIYSGEVEVYGKKTRKWRTVYLDAKALKHLSDYHSKLTLSKPLTVANRERILWK